MVPQRNFQLTGVGVKRIQRPTRTYRLDLYEPDPGETASIRPGISGYVDGVDAMKQAVFKILRTERYRYEIYGWGYGVELEDLYGKPKPFVKAELPRRIREALLADDRINNVDGFTFAEHTTADRRTTVSLSFMVHTVHGQFNASREVEI